MTRSPTARSLAIALALMTSTAGASQSAGFEPRAMAMGGSGVAGGSGPNAVLLNPALLAADARDDRFSFTLPIGARLADNDDLIDGIDDFTDAAPIRSFGNAIAGYDGTPAFRTALERAGEELITRFEGVSGKALEVEGRAALALGIPGKRLGVSVFAGGYVLGNVVGNFSTEDRAAIEAVIDAARAGDATLPDPIDDFSSSIEARFATVAEAGIAIATQFDVLGGLSVGIVPKYVQVRSYDYAFRGRQIDDAEIDLDQGEHKDSDVNLDLGIATGWGDGWVAGLAVRDLVSREYRTVRGNTVKIEPQARIGIARHGERLTVAADLDLTERAPLGMTSKRRYASVGAEFDLFRTLQVRAGYRHNLSDLPDGQEAGVYSAGLGLSPFGLRIDLAVMGNSDEIGASGQIGVRF